MRKYVLGDESLRRKKFSSLFGIVSLIVWNTGKVIDIIVKNKLCKACNVRESGKDTAVYSGCKIFHESV